MRVVVFVAPFVLAATRRFVEAVAALADVKLVLLTQQRREGLPSALHGAIEDHEQLDDALDPDGIREAVRRVESRFGEVTRLLGTLEEIQVPLARVRADCGIEGMSEAAASRFRDKPLMKRALRAAGLPCARHAVVESAAEACAFARETGYPLVVKPPAGSGARATFRVPDEGALARAFGEVARARGYPVLVEEFVGGEEHSFDAVSIAGRPVWYSLSRYVPAPLAVNENPDLQWVVVVPREVDAPCYDGVRFVASRALEVLGMDTGVTHLEWFRRPDGSVTIGEVAARPPGAQFCSLISYANDFDFYGAWAQVVVDGTFEPPPRRYAAGAAYLRGRGDGRVREVHGIEAARRELGEVVVEVSLPTPGESASRSYEGDGYVLVRHPETRVVEQALARILELVRVELA